jgi:hypothetical protein
MSEISVHALPFQCNIQMPSCCLQLRKHNAVTKSVEPQHLSYSERCKSFFVQGWRRRTWSICLQTTDSTPDAPNHQSRSSFRAKREIYFCIFITVVYRFQLSWYQSYKEIFIQRKREIYLQLDLGM